MMIDPRKIMARKKSWTKTGMILRAKTLSPVTTDDSRILFRVKTSANSYSPIIIIKTWNWKIEIRKKEKLALTHFEEGRPD